MSNIGISIAGSVAQGSLQVQQVSRALHRQTTDAAAEARQIRDRVDAHLAALDEGDEANPLSQLRIDEQMPEHGHHEAQGGEEEKSQKHAKGEAGEDGASAQPTVPEKSHEPRADGDGYHPLDVTA